jgi:alkaline phosphatase D
MIMVCYLPVSQTNILISNAEIANNGYRDGYSGLRNTEDSFLNYGPQISVDQRKMNAVRAYFEWMPIR